MSIRHDARVRLGHREHFRAAYTSRATTIPPVELRLPDHTRVEFHCALLALTNSHACRINDILLSALYIPLVVFEKLKDYTFNVWLCRFWWTYFIPVLAIAHVLKASR